MKRITLYLLLLFTAAGKMASAQEETEFKLRPEELQLLDLTNQERKQKNLPPVRLSLRLCRIARAHAENMARQGKMEHTLDGKTPLDRLSAAGYRFAKGGENIAAGAADATQPAVVLKAWMDSRSHRENILAPEFTEVGVALAQGTMGRVYYAQVFARPQGGE